MNIGQRIKQRRKELKMSGEELAKLLGKNRSTVFRYENGEIENLPLDVLEPIARALKTTPQHLMGWDEKKETPVIDTEVSESRQQLINFAQSVPEDKADLMLRVMKSILEDN